MSARCVRRAHLPALLLALVGSACANPSDGGDLASRTEASLAALRIIGGPEVVDEEGGAMPHLITTGPDVESYEYLSAQSIAYEGTFGAIRLATRVSSSHDSEGVKSWSSWDTEVIFDEPGRGVVDVSSPLLAGSYRTPYHAFWRNGDEHYEWVSLTRVPPPSVIGGVPSLWLARRLADVDSPPYALGDCGDNDEWECFEISDHPSCDPLLGVDDDGPDRFRAPFVFSDTSVRSDPRTPQRVNIAWVTHGVAVAAVLDPSLDPTNPNSVRCWKIGDDGGFTGEVPDEDFEVRGEVIDAIVGNRPPLYDARAHVFVGDTDTSPGLQQFSGVDTHWTPPGTNAGGNFHSSVGAYPGMPSADTPPWLPRGVPTTFSPVFSAVVSTPEPYPGTMDPCPIEGAREVIAPRRYFYTDDGGQSWAESDIPSLQATPRVCHANVSVGEVHYSHSPSALVFFFSDEDLRVTYATQDGSQWGQYIPLVDAVGGLNPSAVVESTHRRDRLGNLLAEEHYFIHTVAHYDRDNDDLRVVRGSFF